MSGWGCLPPLPDIELRLLGAGSARPLALEMLQELRTQTMARSADHDGSGR